MRNPEICSRAVKWRVARTREEDSLSLGSGIFSASCFGPRRCESQRLSGATAAVKMRSGVGFPVILHVIDDLL